MKDLWTEDAETIQQEMDSLIEGKMELICGRRGSTNRTKLAVVGKTSTKNGPLFILHHPHEPSCGAETCVFYYHSKDNPLRVFEARRVKKAEKFVGFEFPSKIFNIHRRKFVRMATPNTSVVTFSLQHKQRIHNGTVGDISLEGAKLLVDIPGELTKGAILCHLTVTLCYRLSQIQAVLIIAEAEVIWSKFANEATKSVGITFSLSEKDRDALSNYIDMRSIEEAARA